MKIKFVLCVLLFVSITITLSAQVRYVRNIPIQIPDWAFTPKYTPKQIYPTPDGGVIILGDCQARYGDPDWPGIVADCEAIKLNADGNCQWQWWSRNFIGNGEMSIVGIDQNIDGRVNFLIKNQGENSYIGWIDPQEVYSLLPIQLNNCFIYRALRLPNNDIFAIGARAMNEPLCLYAYFLHMNAQGDSLASNTYPPDSLWIMPSPIRAQAWDMELDTDGMPVSTCTFSDYYASVVKTDWDGNIIWRYDTNTPYMFSTIAITKIPLTSELIIGFPTRYIYSEENADYHLYKITNTGLDSLFVLDSLLYSIGYSSLIGHNQELFIAGSSQFTQTFVANYNMAGLDVWTFTHLGLDTCQGTDRIVILPDSSLMYVFSTDVVWDNVLQLLKLNLDGTGNDEEYNQVTNLKINVYPNPMRSNLNIEIKLNREIKPSARHICIYNTKGQLARQIKADYKSSNVLTSHWDGCDASGRPCASGVYFLKYQDEDIDLTRKIMVIR